MPSSSLSSAIGEGGDLKPGGEFVGRRGGREEVEVGENEKAKERKKKKHWRQGHRLSQRVSVASLSSLSSSSMTEHRRHRSHQRVSKVSRVRPELARKDKKKENHILIHDGQQPIRRLRGYVAPSSPWLPLLFSFSHCLEHACEPAPPPPQRSELLDKRLQRNRAEPGLEGKKNGQAATPACRPFSMACGKEQAKKRSTNLPSPALLALRVEIVAVLVMR